MHVLVRSGRFDKHVGGEHILNSLILVSSDHGYEADLRVVLCLQLPPHCARVSMLMGPIFGEFWLYMFARILGLYVSYLFVCGFYISIPFLFR